MHESGSVVATDTVASPAKLPAGLRARMWIAARYFFSRRDAQDRCWLWLHRDDGRVHALWLPATCLDRDELIAALLAQLDNAANTPAEIASGLGHAWPLPGAPVVPLTRWSVSWGHPVTKAIRAFADGLDAQVLDALGQLEVPGPFFGSVENYNRLAALPAWVRQHRLQALARFPPLVAPVLLDVHERADMLGTDEDVHPLRAFARAGVLDAIDRGRDLIGALAEHHRIDRALVRSPLCRSPWSSGHVPHEMLRLLHALPAHARPRSLDEFEAQIPLLGALPFRPRSNLDVERLARAFAAGWKRVWQSVEQRFRPLQTAMRDTRDFLTAALAEAVLPPATVALDVHMLGHAWLARRGLGSLLEASRRWHAQPLVTPPAPATTTLPQSVAALLGEAQQAEGHLRELHTQAALIEEGAAMKHCVADYWNAVVRDGTRLFHLGLANGETATAEYRLKCDFQDALFALDQLRGPYNAEPSAAMEMFAEHVGRLLNAEALLDQRQQLRHAAQAYARQNQYAPAQPRLRRLDRRSREELAQVLAYACDQDDWRLRHEDVLRASIAGFDYAHGPRLLNLFAVGDALTLAREPANPHDARAVRIDWNGHKLGYVPREHNTQIAQWLDNGFALDARILDVSATNHVWRRVQFAVSHARTADSRS